MSSLRRQAVGKLGASTQVLLVAGILALVNFLAWRHFVRWDFTAGRQFTLAPSSRRIVGGLKDIVTVDVYFSQNLPPYLTGLREGVRDLLDEYKAFGGRNIQVRSIIPEDDPATEQRMRMLDIPQVQLNVLERDQFQVSRAYLGLAVLYGSRKEVIPVVQETESLEYRLTAAILKVTREEPVTVALAAGETDFGAEGSSDGYGLLRQELQRQYTLSSYRFGGDLPIPPPVGALIVAGPRELSDADLFRLDQFVMRGGRLILLADAVELEEGSLMGRRLNHRLDRLLKAWGVELKPEVVVDPRANALASFSSGFMRLRIPYPFWPDVRDGAFDQKHPIVSRLESLVMPWTSPLNPAADAPKELEYVALARSSPASWTEAEPFDVTPGRRGTAPAGNREAKDLAVLVSGIFKSAFPSGPPQGIGEAEKKDIRHESTRTSVLVAGNSRLAQDGFLEQFPENGIFIMNAVDWMAQGQDLIGIRSRGVTDRPIPELSEKAKSVIRYANYFGVSLLLVVAGAVRCHRRRQASAVSL